MALVGERPMAPWWIGLQSILAAGLQCRRKPQQKLASLSGGIRTYPGFLPLFLNPHRLRPALVLAIENLVRNRLGAALPASRDIAERFGGQDRVEHPNREQAILSPRADLRRRHRAAGGATSGRGEEPRAMGTRMRPRSTLPIRLVGLLPILAALPGLYLGFLQITDAVRHPPLGGVIGLGLALGFGLVLGSLFVISVTAVVTGLAVDIRDLRNHSVRSGSSTHPLRRE
jgi:hypothetical protein